MKATTPPRVWAVGQDQMRGGAVQLADICRELGPVVYFIRTKDGLVKIGHTSNLANRKRNFGSGWHHILVVMRGSAEDEKYLHETFRPLLARGREYYRPEPPLLHHINLIRRRLGVPDVVWD